MKASAFFVLFGLVFVAIAIGQVFYNLHNATSRNRFSSFEITSPREERDPLEAARTEEAPPRRTPETQARFCTECGAQLQYSYKFCPECGKAI